MGLVNMGLVETGGTSDNAPRSEAGWVSPRDKLHGRVVERRRVVEMALPIIVIRRLTDERGAQPRVASKRVRGLPKLQAGAPASPASVSAVSREPFMGERGQRSVGSGDSVTIPRPA